MNLGALKSAEEMVTEMLMVGGEGVKVRVTGLSVEHGWQQWEVNGVSNGSSVSVGFGGSLG